MDPTERRVKTWMASNSQEYIDLVAADVSSGETNVLIVVKALGEYLTSEDDSLRSKGVEFLSLVLGKFSQDTLNAKTTNRLSVFYCSKLEDTETIVPALQGLVSLADQSSVTADEAVSIIRSMFLWVNMKALVQSVRFYVFTIFDIFMTKHRQALKNMNKEFLDGYLNLAEGEKDPRNLLLAFAIARVILIEFEVTDHIEALFNVTFCYFPITFRPPPNDPYGITTEDLRLKLRLCLNASPLFGPLAVPVFLEKLLGGSPITKRDTLDTMADCFPVYGSTFVIGVSKKLWGSIKLEIFQPTDAETADRAVVTLKALVSTIYSGANEIKDEDGFVHDTCSECLGIIRAPDTSQAKPAMKVLSALMSSTPAVSIYTTSKVVPYIVRIFTDLENTSSRPSTLLLLSDLIAATRDAAVSAVTETNSIIPYKDEVLSIVTTGLGIPAARRPALACLLGLVSSKELLSDEEISFIVLKTTELLIADADEVADSSESVLQLLSAISHASPRHVEQQTLPVLFNSLPDQAPAKDLFKERTRYQQTLSALRILCQPPPLFEVLVIRLTTKLDILGAARSTESAQVDKETTAAYAHSILVTLLHTITAKVDDKDIDVPRYITRLLPRLFNLFVYAAYTSEESYWIYREPRLLTVAGQVVTKVLEYASLEQHQVFSTSLFAAFLQGTFHGLAEGQQKVPSDGTIQPLRHNAPTPQQDLVVLFSAGVVPLRSEVSVPVPDLAPLLRTLLNWTLDHASSDIQKTAIWQIMSSIINKRSEDTQPFLNDLVDQYWNREATTGENSLRRKVAVQSWGWISKALVVRNHPSGITFSTCLFELFSDPEVNWEAAKVLGSIISTGGILVKRLHASVKLLHAQRYVSAVLPRIMNGAQDSTNSVEQPAYLVALASLIKSAPRATYVADIPKLVPLLLRGLDLPDYEIRADVIDTLLAAAEGDSPEKGMVAEHASSLVASMLKNASVQEVPSVKLRVAAIQYLGKLTSIVRYDVLHPKKQTVIRGLSGVLDDPKKAVRKEAVDTRTIWFKYGGS